MRVSEIRVNQGLGVYFFKNSINLLTERVEKLKLFYSRLPKKGPKNLEFVMEQF